LATGYPSRETIQRREGREDDHEEELFMAIEDAVGRESPDALVLVRHEEDRHAGHSGTIGALRGDHQETPRPGERVSAAPHVSPRNVEQQNRDRHRRHPDDDETDREPAAHCGQGGEADRLLLQAGPPRRGGSY
jgi:hypothetical protein